MVFQQHDYAGEPDPKHYRFLTHISKIRHVHALLPKLRFLASTDDELEIADARLLLHPKVSIIKEQGKSAIHMHLSLKSRKTRVSRWEKSLVRTHFCVTRSSIGTAAQLSPYTHAKEAFEATCAAVFLVYDS